MRTANAVEKSKGRMDQVASWTDRNALRRNKMVRTTLRVSLPYEVVLDPKGFATKRRR